MNELGYYGGYDYLVVLLIVLFYVRTSCRILYVLVFSSIKNELLFSSTFLLLILSEELYFVFLNAKYFYNPPSFGETYPFFMFTEPAFGCLSLAKIFVYISFIRSFISLLTKSALAYYRVLSCSTEFGSRKVFVFLLDRSSLLGILL